MRIVALISGSGTTLRNLLDRGFPVVGVVASRPGIGGLSHAEVAGIPSVVVGQGDKGTRGQGEMAGSVPLSPGPLVPLSNYSERVFAAVRQWQPDLVCLCGWLKLLRIPEDFRSRVLNIHPSLLPAFGGKGMYGLKVHQAVLDANCAESGCTVHYADNSYDTGEVILQKRVPVLKDDTAETLAKRVYQAECEAYSEAITQVARMRGLL